jgi:hypothetical protein
MIGRVGVSVALVGLLMALGARNQGASAAQAQLAAGAAQTPPAARVTLDYDYFKAKVQPIFLAKREGHARCYACHYTGGYVYGNGAPFLVEKLADGQTTYTEQQSRSNFDMISVRVVPGNLKRSILLTHPLVPEAGGDTGHPGGKHWVSTTDDEWQTIAAWVMGSKLTATNQ